MPTVTKSENEVRKYIKGRILDRFGSYAEYARKKEVAPSYVANVMRGVKPIPEWMLAGFRVKHIVDVTYEIPK